MPEIAPTVIGLDHLMVLVDDLAAATREAGEAGFTTTPVSLTPGLANRLVCFGDVQPGATSFIEFLHITDAGSAPPAVLELLGPTAGPAAIVVAVRDAASYCAHLRRIGVGHSEPLTVRRQWAVGGSACLDVHLEVVLIDPLDLPVPCIAVRHYTAEHYLRREFVTHENGSHAISAVVVAAEDPAKAAARFGRLVGEKVLKTPNGPAVNLPGTQFRFRRGEPGIAGALLSGRPDAACSQPASSPTGRPPAVLSGLPIAWL